MCFLFTAGFITTGNNTIFPFFPLLCFLSLCVCVCLSQMMAKFAEDDRIEQMNAQKRRMKQLEHRRAVERLIQERREQFQRQKVSPTGDNK